MNRALALALTAALVVGVAAGLSPEPPAAVSAPAPRWNWPLPAPHSVARPFIAPATPYAAGHRGLDIRGTGDVVLAPADGTVHFTGTVVDRPVVSIDHGGGVLSSFEPVASTLAKGDTVRRGEVIGTLQPGHCARPCLHLGARLDGEYVSPLLYLGGIPRSVLIPTRTLG